MKKIIAILLALFMLVSVIPMTVSAAKNPSGKCGDNLYWTLDEKEGVLSITGTGAMYDYNNETKTPWYSCKNDFATLIISEGVTSLGDRAFNHCSKLVCLNIPSTVKSIGQDCFRACYGIESIEIPDTVTSIGYSAFRECSSLVNFNTGDGITEMPALMFFKCVSLKNLVIGNSVKTVNKEAFNMCYAIEEITFGNSVETIEKYALAACTSLKKIVVPKSLKKIGAKDNCNNLQEIYCLGTSEDWFSVTGALSYYSGINKTFNEHTHTPKGSWRTLSEGSCTSVAAKDLQCSVCNGEIDLKVTGYKHQFGSYTYNNDATCSSDGTETSTCDVCNKIDTRTATGTKLSHYAPFVAAKEATYRAEGNIAHYRCANCKHYFADHACTQELSENSVIIPKKELPFTDVSENDWFFDSVCYCTDKGYFHGMTKTTFGPNYPLTREQFMQILFAFSGEDAENYQGTVGYSDVPSGQWYSAAIKWAKDTDVTHGIGGGLFGLGQPITREQFALLLMNYAKHLGYSTTARASLYDYGDWSDVSYWAVEAIQWAVAEKLIFGTAPGKLSPLLVADRASASMVFMNFDKYLEK